MALIEWSDSLSVGVATFDEQHKKLIAMINNLNDAMKVGKSKEVLGGILKGVIDYTATHFASEEKAFDQFGYLQALAHKVEHKKLVAKVTQFDKEFREGKAMMSIEIMNFLKEWLSTHILGTDKKYGPFLREKGM